MKKRTFAGMVVVVMLAAGRAQAANKYSSGTKTWDTTSSNWGTVSGGPYNTSTWDNAAPDSAFLEAGSVSVVTLSEAISIQSLTMTSPSANYYTITNNTLNFAASGAITNNSTQGGNFIAVATIKSGITGAPKIVLNTGANIETAFAPTTGTMALGAVSGAGMIQLGGSTTGNSLASTAGNKTRWNGSGAWTLTGVAYAYEHFISSGDLVIGAAGTIRRTGTSVYLNGGTLHWNNPSAVGGLGNTGDLTFGGGKLDNSSGAAITTCTYSPNPGMSWNADWTFIGSQGANSDLYLGTGAVLLGATRTVTVSNALTTLTVGGVIGDAGNARGLTKAGDGTLKLTGANTYTGETVVNAGTLSITKTYLSDIAAVRIADGATLNLDYVGTDTVFKVYTNGVEGPTGTWGAIASGADNETALITGTGVLNAPVPTALEGIRYWDGGTTDIAGTGNAISGGGAGTWSTSVKNWDCGAGVAYTNWNNANTDLAIFKGTPGTVTLAEDITLGGIFIYDVNGYTITNNTLNFPVDGSGAITNYSTVGGNWVTVDTIKSGITGAPKIVLNTGANIETAFAPTTGTMALGAVSGAGMIQLGGSTTGNVLASTAGNKTRWNGSGAWTLTGVAYAYEHFISSGDLVIGAAGTIRRTNNSIYLDGGTLHWNNPAAVGGLGNTGDLTFRGGKLDNSSGAAITTCTYSPNPGMSWNADWTFIGSQGANSDLYLGTGAVLLSATRTVTVSNALTTLTVGGVIGDGGNARGLTKAGDGTLKLTGANTYTGETRVDAGTLGLSGGNNIFPDATAVVRVASGAKVDLGTGVTETIYRLYLNDGQAAGIGTWGSRSSSAQFKDDEFFTGTGVINVTDTDTGVPPFVVKYRGTVVIFM